MLASTTLVNLHQPPLSPTSLLISPRIQKQLQLSFLDNQKLTKRAMESLDRVSQELRSLKASLHTLHRWALSQTSRSSLLYRVAGKIVAWIFSFWTKAEKRIDELQAARIARSLQLKKLWSEKKGLNLVVQILKGSLSHPPKLQPRWEDLEWIPGWMKDCKPIQIEIMKFEGRSLRFASPHLQADLDVVINAVQNSAGAIVYARPTVRNNEKVLQAAFCNKNEMPPAMRGKLLSCATHFVKSDRDKVLLALSKDGASLQHLDDSMKLDKEIVLTAVNSDGLALRFAPLALRNNKRIVEAAIQQNANALIYASKELKNNPQVALIAVKKNGSVLRYLNESLRHDYDIVLAAVTSNAELALPHASRLLRGNKTIALQAIEASGKGHLLQFLSDELKNDLEVVWQAIQSDPENIRFASKELQNLSEILKAP